MDDFDYLGDAIQHFFGLSYLFPYQRLVITNILEAAAASGLSIAWPGEIGGLSGEPPEETLPEPSAEACFPKGSLSRGSPPEAEDQDEGCSDRAGLGRQIVILPTGAGKSLCFQLPAMLLPGPTLVIYPILSLMADQERRLRDRGFAPVILRGGQSPEEREEIWRKIRSGESRFIIANPEVLLTPQVLEKLGGLKILHIVIDEAHCVSEWGESFRPSYLQIGEIIAAARAGGGNDGAAGEPDTGGGLPLVTAFTATASAPVLEKIETFVFSAAGEGGMGGAHRIIGNPDRSNIEYFAQGALLRDLAVRDLLLRYPRPAIVFCSSRRGTEKLARYLRITLDDKAAGEPAAEIRFYHAGLSREEKTAVEKWFFSNPIGILVSTCAYGMGVDKADIRTVIHRDCPPSVEAYLQESGRAGRDGLLSRAILLWGPDDELSRRRAGTGANRSRLEQLLAYGRDTGSCRRQTLLKLLNYQSPDPEAVESPESHCCDVCEGVGSPFLREERSLHGFFRKNRRVYTLKEAAVVLSLQDTVNWSEDEAKQAVTQLIRLGTLGRIKNFLWKDRITIGKGAYSSTKPRSSPSSPPLSSGWAAAFFTFLGFFGLFGLFKMSFGPKGRWSRATENTAKK
ncbi:ATP-dependent DNA helicase RecQ [Spirochaetia bacterium]|nr:ATP-dependent DNA helicase RecQ [Spirochaetia bacterium]